MHASFSFFPLHHFLSLSLGLCLLTLAGCLLSVPPGPSQDPVLGVPTRASRYQGPHTHTHHIPPLAAKGEGEVNISLALVYTRAIKKCTRCLGLISLGHMISASLIFQ